MIEIRQVAVLVFRIPRFGALLHDDLERLAAILIQQIVDGAGGHRAAVSPARTLDGGTMPATPSAHDQPHNQSAESESRYQGDRRAHLIYIVYLMSAPPYLGEFEHIVLLAVLRLDDNAYGVTVRQEIETRTGRDVSIGAIYATLSRLETKGLVRSRSGEPTPERGGRGKRLFRVTALGRRSMTEAQRVLARMLDGLHPVESFS